MPYFADVVLPLALPKKTYTYDVPDDWADQIRPGVRVEVPFGQSKMYSGVVQRVHEETPPYRVKSIISVLDEVPIVSPQQFQLWDWLASYYCCTMGEVMSAALPGHLKLASETKLVRNEAYSDDFTDLPADAYLIAEAITIQTEITIEDARKILGKKTVLPVIQQLMQRGILYLREDLQEKYKARTITAVRWAQSYSNDPDLIKNAFELTAKSPKQAEVLMAFVMLSRTQPFVGRKQLMQKADVSDGVLQALVKKEILEIYDREVSRLADYQAELIDGKALSPQQQTALGEIKASFAGGKNVVLLHGVTGSGKTQLYIEMMRKVLLDGGQALYMLPEIALTTQIVSRLQKVFGSDVCVYHSKINYNERVEVWKAAASGKSVVLGARSSLFLPFKNLQLIIVDEEHDPSFKQYDPAPRYHARDTAIYLANIYKAKTLLGTATPSIETYHNATTGKYGYVQMKERFGGLQLPETVMVDLRDQMKRKLMHSIFSQPLLDALQETMDKGEQAILFQNRRGYSPILECQTCAWTQMCVNCDVSLTYHKQQHRLRCHYCNHTAHVPETCPACGSGKLVMLGFGTEKIEDELKIFLPKARIARMDMDTMSSKTNLMTLLNDFEERQLDILVGTQMVTKGLDFDNVSLVGVLGADQLLKFPDFRSGERTFQLLTQVSGRAGRKHKQGRVLIQAYAPQHPILQDVLRGDFDTFVQRELDERKTFNYPPFVRLIQVHLQHKDEKIAAAAAAFFTALLRDKLGPVRVLGPVVPSIPRVRNLFGQNTMIKMEKDPNLLAQAKQWILYAAEMTTAKKGWSQVRINIDVDPV